MRNQRTRNKYTLCHKDTIALNDDSLELILEKTIFLQTKRKKSESQTQKNDSGTKPSGIIRFGLQIRHLVVILYSSAVIFCHLIIKRYISNT